jgi:hypothetical protein
MKTVKIIGIFKHGGGWGYRIGDIGITITENDSGNFDGKYEDGAVIFVPNRKSKSDYDPCVWFPMSKLKILSKREIKELKIDVNEMYNKMIVEKL